MNLQDYRFRVLDHARQSQLDFWNALLTFNSILISVFAASAIIKPNNKWMFVILVIIPIMSSLLLIKNFNQMRNTDILKLKRLDQDLTQEERDADLEQINTERVEQNHRVNWVEGLLFVEAVIIVLILLSS